MAKRPAKAKGPGRAVALRAGAKGAAPARRRSGTGTAKPARAGAARGGRGAVGGAPAAIVVLDVELRSGVLELVLANAGAEPAVEVRVEFSRRLVGVEGIDVSGLRVFSGLGLLRPGREVRVVWDSLGAVLSRRGGGAFSCEVSWKDRTGAVRAEYRHDAAIYRDLV